MGLLRPPAAEAARAGTDPVIVIAEIEEDELKAGRAERLLPHLEPAQESAQRALGAFAGQETMWAALDRALQQTLDRAEETLKDVPPIVNTAADLRSRELSRAQVGKIRDKLGELEDLFGIYGRLRGAASGLAVTTFTPTTTADVFADPLEASVFSWRTGFRVFDSNKPRWPEGDLPFLRFVLDHRSELHPWTPSEEAWRAACTAALNEIVPEHIREMRASVAGSW